MSLEPGGRADKYGNQYENLYLVNLYIELISGNLRSITVEPLGPNHDAFEYIAEQKNSITNYYQCKSSNATNSYWRISDLIKYDIFSRAHDIIIKNTNSEYYFISPLTYGELEELCKRCRSSESIKNFITYQLNNEKIKEIWEKIGKNLNLNTKEHQEELRYILSHCHFNVFPFDDEAEKYLNNRLSLKFTGSASLTRLLLEDYAIERNYFGKKITVNDITSYLEENKIHLREYEYSESIIKTIETINTDYYGYYNGINDQLIHRSSTDEILNHIANHKSIIVHGKAGSGKSGCLQEIRNYLKDNNIIFISIKLDTKIPTGTADEYGKSLGLRESPILCLATIASGKKAVLILDQLDALRWTNSHSPDALTVCKELISQCKGVNEHEGADISIIFASRTFDLETDHGLKELFHFKNENGDVMWEKVEVPLFSENDIKKIIGSRYDCLPTKMRKILLTPSSLYIWSKLDCNIQSKNFSSIQTLMATWWSEILRQCHKNSIQEERLIKCRDQIVNYMENKSLFVVPDNLFSDFHKEIGLLKSAGLLIRNSNNNISFSHQSFLDYFITEENIHKICAGNDITDFIAKYDNQTPFSKYRLIILLQALLDINHDIFTQESLKILESEDIHYYFKCSVFETISQCQQPNTSIYDLLENYIYHPDWEDFIYHVVLCGHAQFIQKFLSFSDEECFNNKNLYLLGSITESEPNYVADTVNRLIVNNNLEKIEKIWKYIFEFNDPDKDSDKLFSIRIKILKTKPEFLCESGMISKLVEKNSHHAVSLLNLLLENWCEFNEINIYIGHQDILDKFSEACAKEITKILIPTIQSLTENFIIEWPLRNSFMKFHDWTKQEYIKSPIREIINIVKKSLSFLAIHSPQYIYDYFNAKENSNSAIIHELRMHALSNLPVSYSNSILEWLLLDFDKHIFVFTDDTKDYLKYTKIILKKFTQSCDISIFGRIEKKIFYWRESYKTIKRNYKHRIESHHYKGLAPQYDAFWGHLQKSLLPYLDRERISRDTAELILVLNRNEWILSPYFHLGIEGYGGMVVSPIDDHLDRITNKTWLQIVSTPTEKMNERYGKCINGDIIKISHETFARSLGKQAEKEPERFAKLALSFPTDCHASYISNIFYALNSKSTQARLTHDIICNLIRKNLHRNNTNISLSILHCIEHSSMLDWPPDILEYIKELSLDNDPDPQKSFQGKNSEYQDSSYEELYTKSLNCVRGCVLHVISAFLWHHKELLEYFIDIIKKLMIDPCHEIRIACMKAIYAIYNINPELSVNLTCILTKQEPYIICSYEWWNICSRSYSDKNDFYNQIISESIQSKNKDIAKYSAKILCALAIFTKDEKNLKLLKTFHFSAEQQEEICKQAIDTFDSTKHYQLSKDILISIIKTSTIQLYPLKYLFIENFLSPTHDEDLIRLLMGSPQSLFIVSDFLNYLLNIDKSICNYFNILFSIANNNFSNESLWIKNSIADSFSKCMIKLLDYSKNNTEVRRECLKILDVLFKNNQGSFISLSKLLNSIEDN